jgi:hypothetical protein
MKYVEINDSDGTAQLINLNQIIKVVEDPTYHISDSDVAHRTGSTVRIYLRRGDFIRANWTLTEFKEIMLNHRVGQML